MPVKKLFWQDPYLTATDAQILHVKENMVKLDQTVFYACSGGQASDSGTIGGFAVLQAEKKGLEIEYMLPSGHTLQKGDTARVEIDWARRYRLMKLHFAAELVLEWVYQQYNHPDKIGANITPDKARVDFKWEGNISDIFPPLQEALNAFVHANLPIISRFEDEPTQRRCWEITNFATVPCGGTHLHRTAEIGLLRLKRANIGQGKERIEIYLAEQNLKS